MFELNNELENFMNDLTEQMAQRSFVKIKITKESSRFINYAMDEFRFEQFVSFFPMACKGRRYVIFKTINIGALNDGKLISVDFKAKTKAA